MLAGRERALREGPVEGGGQADVDRVDLRVGDRRVEIVREPGAHELGHPCRALRVAGGDRLDADAVAERLVVGGMSLPHEAAPENRDGDRQCASRNSRLRLLNSSGISQKGACPISGQTWRVEPADTFVNGPRVCGRSEDVRVPDRDQRRRADLADRLERRVGETGLGLVAEVLRDLRVRVFVQLPLELDAASLAARRRSAA